MFFYRKSSILKRDSQHAIANLNSTNSKHACFSAHWSLQASLLARR